MDNEIKYGTGQWRGVIVDIAEPRSGSKDGKDWFFGEIVVKSDFSQYPKDMPFTVKKKEQHDRLQLEQQVEISFALDSREWNGKHYPKPIALYIKSLGDAVAPPAQARTATPPPAPAASAQEVDDLPF